MRTLRGVPSTRFASLLWLLAGAELACSAPASTGSTGGPPVPPTKATAQDQQAPGEPVLGDRNWGVQRSARLGLKLALPEARSWLDDAGPARPPEGSSWTLRHEPTGSVFVFRVWRASRLPHLDVCQQELSQRSPELPEMNETNLIASRSVHAPEGFTTRINLLLLANKGTRWRGLAVAVGAGVGTCLAAVASTECDSEAELTERLRLFEITLAHLRTIQIEDRVPARASPPSSESPAW